MIQAADARPSARQALLVLGMHRSGTSALTRVLGLCGAALPLHNMAAGDGNPLGHWEPQPIVDAHDRFLEQAGTGWEAIADYPPALFASEPAAACRRVLADLARSEYGDAPLLILKDPRVSRLMQLWRPVLGELGIAPLIVIMVRNPLEIAASLKRRNGWSEHRALMVWLRYVLAAERDTRDLPRCFVGYGQLMNGWRGVVDTISDRLGIEFPRRTTAVEQAIDGFVRPDLRHHRQQADALLQRDDIAGCIKLAYRSFGDAAEGGALDQAALDRIAETLAHADDALAGLTDRKTRPAAVREQAGALEIDDTLAALMLAEIEQANDIAAEAERALGEMRATLSWRLTKPFRAFGRMVGKRARQGESAD